MTFRGICLEALAVAEGMENGTVSFTYDKLASAMKMGHPAEFLMECLDDVFNEIQNDIAPKKEKAVRLLKGLKRIQRNFKIKELSKPIKDLSTYIDTMESND